VEVVEVLDDFARKDRVELPIEVEVLGVGQLHIEPFFSQGSNRLLVDVDPDNFGKALDDQACNQSGFP